MSNTNTYVQPKRIKERPIQTLTGASDAIDFSKGDVFILNRTSAVNSSTLAVPISYKDDWRRLMIINGTTQQNTITVASGLGGSAHATITFAATVDCNVILQAYKGYWYVIGGYGATVS
jgi:hypothetical protein